MKISVLNFQQNSNQFLIALDKVKQKYRRFVQQVSIYSQVTLENFQMLEKSDIYFILLDQCNNDMLSFIKQIRRLEEISYFVFIVKKNDDIHKLICPSIRPSAVIEHPVKEKKIEQIFDEILIDQRKRVHFHEKLTLKIEGEIYQIPLSMILYFEARNKKMIVRTFGQEISFYSTFNKIQEKVNNSFIRCHKGFLVNSNEIKQINNKESLIVLTNGFEIPFSRSYKENIKKWINERIE